MVTAEGITILARLQGITRLGSPPPAASLTHNLNIDVIIQ